MEEHPAIAVAICQTLSRRIRNLLDDRLDALRRGGRHPRVRRDDAE